MHIIYEFLNLLWINIFLVLDFYGYKKWFTEKSVFHFGKHFWMEEESYSYFMKCKEMTVI